MFKTMIINEACSILMRNFLRKKQYFMALLSDRDKIILSLLTATEWTEYILRRIQPYYIQGQ